MARASIHGLIRSKKHEKTSGLALRLGRGARKLGRATAGRPRRCRVNRCWWPSEPIDCGDLSLEVFWVLVVVVLVLYLRSCCLVSSVTSVVHDFDLCVGLSLMVCKRVGLAVPLIPVLRGLTDVRGEDAQQDVEPRLPRCGFPIA